MAKTLRRHPIDDLRTDDRDHHPDPRRWNALIFIATAQLMVVLDVTIVNIALPSAQADLGIPEGHQQWVVTAYALAFGGLLQLGGRVADLWGRRKAFLTGLIGFALASAAGGAAVDTAMLLGARALQGLFAALLAPAVLSLLSVMFTDPGERAKAFGVFAAVGCGGGGLGLLLGGVLTEYLNWRWTLFVNVPLALVPAIGTFLVVREPPGARNTARLDIPGAVLVTLGVLALVYGFGRAETDGWTSAGTLVPLAAATLLLAAFVSVESRAREPLLPLRVLTERNRAGFYASMALGVVGVFGTFLFTTYYLQDVRGFSPVMTGLAFLPLTAAMVVGATQLGARLMVRVEARKLIASGLLVAALGAVFLAGVDVHSPYATTVLPGLILMGLGIGTSFMPAGSLAPAGVRPQDAGAASAMVDTSQQLGGAIGIALLSTIAASATAAHGKTGADRAAGAAGEQHLHSVVHGYTTAFWWSAALQVLAAVLAYTLINTRDPQAGQRHRTGEERGVRAG
ncbi:MFS transporter [Streptomyces sp. WAC01280]|uniref:MFS transporter n=1 Tax=Streptomyces sp. WAC01280 TaxID=2487424 RepID=UPI000F78AF9D|nr:MFS transporter [Streptomyces sp. WAC01280]RSS54078.1 DHA2 family efflux MFS transporter permease subunit [Streptomyces sp. WAC01280]